MLNKTLFAATLLSLSANLSSGQNSRLQVIHNSADMNAQVVDVYANGAMLIDNFSFRTSSPFINVPGNTPITLAIAPGNSTSSAQAVFTATVTFSSDSSYVAVANGIVSSSGYSPATPFELSLYNMARESAGSSGNTDVLVAHGCTDAGTVDVRAIGNAAPLVNDIQFGDFAGYLQLPTADYILNVTTPDGETIAGSFTAPLQTLNLQGNALVVVASGFVDPSANSNGPSFGLWASLPTGGPLVQLPANTMSKVQVIHNCADAAAATVDVYANNDLLINDFAFRTASPYVMVPAGVPINLGVAPATSTSASDAIFNKTVTLDAGKTYSVVASGIVSPSGYNPAPAFDLITYDMAREAGSAANAVDLLVMHGCTDAPTVDIRSGSNVLVNNISFGEFAADYLELPLDDYTVDVTLAEGNTIVKRYNAPLETLGLGGKALVALASGFLDPANNSNSANTFGLWVALPTGGPLVQLSEATTSISGVKKMNAPTTVYPNPVSNTLYFENAEFKKGSIFIYDLLGRKISDRQEVNDRKLDVSALPKGSYILQISTDKAVDYVKFVKE
jgi:hypothetical protein